MYRFRWPRRRNSRYREIRLTVFIVGLCTTYYIMPLPTSVSPLFPLALADRPPLHARHIFFLQQCCQSRVRTPGFPGIALQLACRLNQSRCTIVLYPHMDKKMRKSPVYYSTPADTVLSRRHPAQVRLFGHRYKLKVLQSHNYKDKAEWHYSMDVNHKSNQPKNSFP